MTSRAQEADLALARWADANRGWGLARAVALYEMVDVEDIDRSMARIWPLLVWTYWIMRARTLTVLDDYWRLKLLLSGANLVFDWRASRSATVGLLPSGMSFAEYQRRAPYGVKALIGSGVAPEAAVRTSLGRTSAVIGTATHRDIRETTVRRAAAIETAKQSPAAALDSPALRPWLEEIATPVRPVEAPPAAKPAPVLRRQYPSPIRPRSPQFDYTPTPLDFADAEAVLDEGDPTPELSDDPYPARTWEPDWRRLPSIRYRRVPSPGACAFCLTLASRGAVYESARVALYRDGGSIRYHQNCRCYAVASGTVRDGMAISRADYDRLLTTYERGPRKGEPRQFYIGKYRYSLDDFQGRITVYDGDEPPWPKF